MVAVPRFESHISINISKFQITHLCNSCQVLEAILSSEDCRCKYDVVSLKYLLFSCRTNVSTLPKCLQASVFTHFHENRNHSTPKVTTVPSRSKSSCAFPETYRMQSSASSRSSREITATNHRPYSVWCHHGHDQQASAARTSIPLPYARAPKER